MRLLLSDQSCKDKTRRATETHKILKPVNSRTVNMSIYVLTSYDVVQNFSHNIPDKRLFHE